MKTSIPEYVTSLEERVSFFMLRPPVLLFELLHRDCWLENTGWCRIPLRSRRPRCFEGDPNRHRQYRSRLYRTPYGRTVAWL